MFVIGLSLIDCAVSTWSTISPAVRFRLKPIVAVAQNLQSRGQPTCVEIQSVSLFSASTDSFRGGMRTLSIFIPSESAKRNFVVPSDAELCRSATASCSTVASSLSRSRSECERVVIASNDGTRCLYSQANSCFARYFGSPIEATKASNCCSGSPLRFVLPIFPEKILINVDIFGKVSKRGEKSDSDSV